MKTIVSSFIALLPQHYLSHIPIVHRQYISLTEVVLSASIYTNDMMN